MRIPTLLFSAGFAVFLIACLLVTDEFNLPLRFQKEKAGAVVSKRAAVAEIVTDPGATSTKRLVKGQLTKIAVYPGVRLVHDPKAGKETILTGPQRMIDLLRTEDTGTELHLDFARPIQATDYLTVTMDLAAHGDYPHVQLSQTLKSRSEFPPLLVTPSPIKVRGLKLTIVDNVEPILVETEQLDISGMDIPGKLQGKTHVLITKDSDSDTEPVAIPGLKVTGRGRASVKAGSED